MRRRPPHLLLVLLAQLPEVPEAADRLSGHCPCRTWPHIYGALLLCRRTLTNFELNWAGSASLGPWLKGFPQLTKISVDSKGAALEAGLEHVAALRELTLYTTGSAVTIASLPLGLTQLCLTNCALSELPACLTSLQSLEALDLGSNNLGHASFVLLSTLTQLTMLSLAECGLPAVPPELWALTGLQMLYLDCLDCIEMPAQDLESISVLSELRVLALPDCDLQALPAELSSLLHLRSLFLHGNELDALAGSALWLGRLKLLSLGLASLCRCAADLHHAGQLECLYISRTGDAREQRCDGMLDALAALPRLQSLHYIRSRLPDGQPVQESFSFLQVLLKLACQPGLVVQATELDDIEWS